MSAMSTLHAEVSDFEAKLHADAGHLVDEFRSIVAKLLGQARADAADVEHATEDAAGPVIAKAEADAAQLARAAVTDAQAAVSGSDKPAA